MWIDISECFNCKFYGGLNDYYPKVFCRRKPPPNSNNWRYENDDCTKVDCPEKPCPKEPEEA